MTLAFVTFISLNLTLFLLKFASNKKIIKIHISKNCIAKTMDGGQLVLLYYNSANCIAFKSEVCSTDFIPRFIETTESI